MFQLDLHRLSVFYTVVNEGTLSKAGDRLYMSQPAISAHIKALEQQLGIPLFYRVGRRSVVNKAGELLYQKAEELFTVADELKTEMENLRGVSVGKLILGASVDWQYRLPKSLERFKREYPGVEVSLEVANSSRIEKMVLDRSVDMGFAARQPSRPEIGFVHLADDEMVPICNVDHPFSKMTEIPVQALSSEMFVVREMGSAARTITDDILKTHNMANQISMELGSYEAIKSTVMAGKGIGFVSTQSILTEINAGLLTIANVPALKSPIGLYFIFLRQKKMAANHQAFIDMVWTRDSVHEEAAD